MTKKPASPPSRWQVASYWAKHRPRWVVDLGEPACFSCGWHHESVDNYQEIKNRWKHSNLELAHVVAKAEGGDYDVSNFVLLCSECHERAPMTTHPEIMFAWIDAHQTPSLVRRALEALGTLQKEGTPLPVNCSAAQMVRVANVLGVGTHGTKITSGSIAAVLRVLAAAQP